MLSSVAIFALADMIAIFGDAFSVIDTESMVLVARTQRGCLVLTVFPCRQGGRIPGVTIAGPAVVFTNTLAPMKANMISIATHFGLDVAQNTRVSIDTLTVFGLWTGHRLVDNMIQIFHRFQQTMVLGTLPAFSFRTTTQVAYLISVRNKPLWELTTISLPIGWTFTLMNTIALVEAFSIIGAKGMAVDTGAFGAEGCCGIMAHLSNVLIRSVVGSICTITEILGHVALRGSQTFAAAAVVAKVSGRTTLVVLDFTIPSSIAIGTNTMLKVFVGVHCRVVKLFCLGNVTKAKLATTSVQTIQ
mmetsp:Transcript_1194/g.2203  ORF Transcript_1194/g.2203 Transcript_1194/m.2203 type:complete len:302 (+) Transcript_1194:518-1423(+)